MIILIGTLCFKVGGHLFDHDQASLNQDSKKVKTKYCVAYYPKGSGSNGKQFAEKLCGNIDEPQEEKIIFDYQIDELNDYLRVDYGQGASYLVDKDFKAPKFDELSERGQMIISDYLRYTLKKNDLDYGYTSMFLEESYYTNISLDSFDDYRFDGDNLYLQFDKYGSEVAVPLKYIAKEIGIDLGYNDEEYIKPVYVDPNRKAIALTFDDGPSLKPECTDKIFNELYKYDSVGTFYVVGSRLYEETEDIIGKGIRLGNEFGSHSCSHAKLTTLTAEEARSEIMDVADWFKDKFNYSVNTYRPPYGTYNQDVDKAVPIAAVLWDVDSVDWKLRDSDAIAEEIGTDIANHSVIIMHDIHGSTAEALVDKQLIKKLIDQGYQLVSVNDIAKLRDVKLEQGVHLCWDH